MSLIRIVRMTFQPDKVEDFLTIFNESKDKIRSIPGCQELQLHKDVHADNIFITYSKWDNEDSLLAYRSSELFASVWPMTKALFIEPVFAFSNLTIEEVDKND